MTDAFDTEIRSTLGVMVAEAPHPLSFNDLAHQTASPTAPRTKWSPIKALSVAFAAVMIAIGAVALLLDPFDGGLSPTDDVFAAVTTLPADEVPATVTTLPADEVPATVTTIPPETPSPSGWSRIPHDADVFGEGRMHSVVAGGPGLVAVGWTGSELGEGDVDGDAAVWTSVDGITWEPSPDHGDVFADGQMASVIVGGPGLVAVGTVVRDEGFEAAIWTSVDGITWTRVPHDDAVLGAASMEEVTVGGPGLVAIGEGESGPAVWTSVDGTAWTRVAHDPAVFWVDSNVMDITAGGPGLVAVGFEWSAGSTGDAVIWTSVDGIVWDRVPHDEDVFGGPRIQVAGAVAATGTRVVAGGVARSTDIDAAVWTSEDGIVWQRVAHDESALGEGQMWDVTVGGPGFVSVGFVGRVLTRNSDAAVWTSIDGVIWDRVPHDEDLFGGVEMWSVAAGGPGLVAVGSDGPDAAVWTSLLDD